VMVDEIHERGMNEDFLLIILRDLLPRRPDLRLVLMSATINAELFSKYFGNAPMMHIPGFTFPVKELFLEDVLELTHYSVGADQGGFSGGGFGGKRRRTQERKRDPVSEAFEDVSIESEYRRYSKATQQSLQVWNGEQIDLGLVGFLLCLPSLPHLLAPASVLIFHASNACNNGCHKRMSLVL
jgi:ATP-dependent RNA helicase DHX36